MLILMKADASDDDIEAVCARIRELGFTPNRIPGKTRVAIGITGNQGAIDPDLFARFPAIAEAVPVSRPWKLVSRDVESRDQLMTTAHAVKSAGAKILRGGAYKPRTSPYAFQGLKEQGLDLLAEARAATGLPVITEIVDTRDVEVVAEHADILQVGARNMQNFALLEAVGHAKKPVLLKRGLSATIQEWLMAAEYIVAKGNYQLILCERGIRTFETMTRNTLDLGAIPLIKRLTHLPVIIDPSHGTGDYRSVPALARAAAAVGADGLMIEVHPDPARALSDGPQSLTPARFAAVMASVRQIAEVVGLKM